MPSVLIRSLIAMLLLAGVSYAADEGKWQEAEAYIEPKARVCSEREKTQRATERAMGCTQQACTQAKKLAAQTLSHDVTLRCKEAIRVGDCHKGPAC